VLEQDNQTVPRIPLVLGSNIEVVLIPHTQQRFRQHSETPYGSGMRSHRLGRDCTSHDAQALSQGTSNFELKQMTLEALEWFRHLWLHQSARDKGKISLNVSTKDWVTFWSKAHESTASSPSGIHYGHYKTASVLVRLPKDNADYSPDIAAFDAFMLQLPLKHGFSPHRWRECTDAVLEKIPGQPKLEKLRIIMLFEADFNYMLKLVWGWRSVHRAEDEKLLGHSQHGSLPGHQCTDACLV